MLSACSGATDQQEAVSGAAALPSDMNRSYGAIPRVWRETKRLTHQLIATDRSPIRASDKGPSLGSEA